MKKLGTIAVVGVMVMGLSTVASATYQAPEVTGQRTAREGLERPAYSEDARRERARGFEGTAEELQERMLEKSLEMTERAGKLLEKSEMTSDVFQERLDSKSEEKQAKFEKLQNRPLGARNKD